MLQVFNEYFIWRLTLFLADDWACQQFKIFRWGKKSNLYLKTTREHAIFVLQERAKLFHLLLESVTGKTAIPTPKCG